MPLPFNKNKTSLGYLPVKEYLYKLNTFSGNGFWKLPLSFMDRVHLFFLKVFIRFSWFSDSIYIQEVSKYGLGYQQLFNYLKDNMGDIKLERIKSDFLAIHVPQWRLYMRKSTNLPHEPVSFGADFDNEVAISKALGEGLERYFTIHKNCISNLGDLELTYGQALSRNKNVCFPPKYHQYTDYQKSKNPFLYKLDDTNITWVKGVNALTMHTALIPKQLISRQCQKLIVPQEGFMNEFTTSGAAGWFTQDGAVTRGLFELIQRDAFMVTWLTKQKIDEIEIESIKNELIIELLRKIKTAKADVCIYKLDSAAKVPTVLVVVYDKCFTKEQVYVTAHTDSTFELAILGAIQEVLPFFYERVQVSVPDNYEPFISRGVNRSLRINLCKSNEMLNCLRNLSSGRYVSINELEKANFKSNSEKSILEELVNKMSLLGEGYTPYFYEYTDKILNKLGFHVVKCFVPKLFPLYLSDHLATIASSRLNTLNERIHSDIISRLETHPHPFA